MQILKRLQIIRFYADRAGVAATEFAIILPVLILMFFGGIELSEAMTVNRRVATAASTLADVLAQSETLTQSEVDGLMDTVTDILEPVDISGLQITVASVELDGSGDPIYVWSRDDSGNEPFSAGTAYPDTDDMQSLIDLDALGLSTPAVIIVEMTYPHTISTTSFYTSSPINFYYKTIRWPREVDSIPLCASACT